MFPFYHSLIPSVSPGSHTQKASGRPGDRLLHHLLHSFGGQERRHGVAFPETCVWGFQRGIPKMDGELLKFWESILVNYWMGN